MEVEALREISGRGPMVASLGGGTLLNPEAIDIIRANGLLVGLRASPEVILERVNRKKDSRPLLAGLDDMAKLAKIKEMLAVRGPLYDLADFQFESDEKIPHHVLTRRIIHRLQVEELKPLRVELGERGYPIYVEADLSGHLDAVADRAGCPRRYLIVTDSNLKVHQRRMLEQMRAALGDPRRRRTSSRSTSCSPSCCATATPASPPWWPSAAAWWATWSVSPPPSSCAASPSSRSPPPSCPWSTAAWAARPGSTTPWART
jgi:hypothetical protein